MDRRALAAVLLVAAGAASAAEEALGPLFFTPEERARLDSLRKGESAVPGTVAAREHALTGYVQRSDGRTTVWIDGRAVSVPARLAPRLDPAAVQDYANDGGGVRVERGSTR